VSLTELSTATLILATLMLPLEYTLALLPFLGVTMNGTSSILYGTVPELVKKENIGRAFAVFYTSVIGSAALAPIVHGAIADHSSSRVGMMVTCVTAVLIVPMVIGLSPFLPERGRAK
jgi:MFS family permease